MKNVYIGCAYWWEISVSCATKNDAQVRTFMKHRIPVRAEHVYQDGTTIIKYLNISSAEVETRVVKN